MIRVIAGVLLGYIVLALSLFAAFTGAYLLMGTERAFRPGTYDISPLWIAVSLFFNLVAALVGGYVAAAVSRGRRAARGGRGGGGGGPPPPPPPRRSSSPAPC
jgi:hypothetical protein